MEPIRIAGFLGSNLAKSPKLLPAEVGAISLNQKPGRGDMRPWKVPLNVATTSTSGRKTIYRYNRDTASDTNYWFQWSTIVHAARVFSADDTTERTCFTGSGTPKVTDNTMALAGAPYPTAARELGVPKPTTAPTLTQTAAGTGTDETRYYVYTYVTDLGEEGMPSPVSASIVCKPGALIDITTMSAPPAGNYGINRIRIYRTQAGQSSSEFFFLREIATATSSNDDARALGTDTLPSTLWAMPPADLKGLTGLWNGMMAGITGKAVRFCEPFRPFAWPAAYEILCSDTPLGLAAFGKTLVILTTGEPRVAYGSAPEAMDDAGAGLQAAVVSVPSIVSFKHGACWATAEGLCYIGESGPPKNITQELMLADDWAAINPSTIVGGQYAGWYVGFYDSGGGVLKGFMVDPLNPASMYFLDAGYSAAYFDPLQRALYVLSGTNIQKWDAGASLMTATFKSKVFRAPAPTNMGYAEVIADAYPVTFKLYADGALKFTKTVASRDVFGLPSGYMADDFQIEVSGSNPIVGVVVAETMEDMKRS